jgi:lipopolysaccharide/colanic/teichoic acid biosynthesis glycosyltransferase
LPVVSGPLSQELIERYQASVVVIADSSLPEHRFDEVLQEARAAKAEVLFRPSQPVETEWLDYLDMDGVLLATFAGPPANRTYEFCKRIFDCVIAALLLVLLGPMLLVLGALVKLDSPGSALFRQQRVGKDGKLFELYKLRSMSSNATPYAFSPTEDADPRITRLGRWLRRTSVDELPQLLNVLKGEMSLVGPRPEMPFIAATYDKHKRERLRVIPGITGLWQISADRAFLIHENVQYDLYYIKNRGFFMDLAILLHTAAFAMRGV